MVDCPCASISATLPTVTIARFIQSRRFPVECSSLLPTYDTANKYGTQPSLGAGARRNKPGRVTNRGYYSTSKQRLHQSRVTKVCLLPIPVRQSAIRSVEKLYSTIPVLYSSTVQHSTTLQAFLRSILVTLTILPTYLPVTRPD